MSTRKRARAHLESAQQHTHEQHVLAGPFGDAHIEAVTQPGVLPDGFYSTTNFPTQVRVLGIWIEVEDIEMDVAIVVEEATRRAFTLPMNAVRVGDHVVVGPTGVRVRRPQRVAASEDFRFMQSAVSSEHAKTLVIHEVADAMRQARTHGGRVLFVLGPAVVHTAARESIVAMIRAGFIQVIFAGNALAAHDAEVGRYGTSLGVDMKTGKPVPHGHQHHLRIINSVRRAGSLRAAHEQGLLGDGIIAAALDHGVDLVLAGSVRDDGPMPDVITDMVAAQAAMRQAVKGVEVAVMVASMLHGIATGNLLSAQVKTFAVDINPAVVTKLADRGTSQAIGLVTDAELFLRTLADALTRQDA
jgi:lysine-ketoglutarate reductase/saccharopine dehydrogenase-like protein (TIGR00300 family)